MLAGQPQPTAAAWSGTGCGSRASSPRQTTSRWAPMTRDRHRARAGGPAAWIPTVSPATTDCGQAYTAGSASDSTEADVTGEVMEPRRGSRLGR